MAELRIRRDRTKEISDHLFGIFLEDIGFGVDGGLNANMIRNYSFDGVFMDPEKHTEVKDPLRYWKFGGESFESQDDGALSGNSRYARVRVNGSAVLENLGYDGGYLGERCAVSIRKDTMYVFSGWIRNVDFEGTVSVCVLDDEGKFLTNEAVFIADSREWSRGYVYLTGCADGYGKLRISFAGSGSVDLDCLELYGRDFWNADDPKWAHGKLRKDLVETLQALHPRFLRFPGGCIVEGVRRGNEYNWKDTVGQLWERKPNFNLWAEKVPDGGYCQSYQIGFYEYFCLCEDLHMMPLPTLNAGLNCQIRKMQYRVKDADYPIDSAEFREYIVSNYVDLIEFANGDPDTNEWAALRRDMGHPEPFGLTMIGIGNENFGGDYEKKFHAIYDVIHEKYPYIHCVRCAGFLPFRIAVRGAWKVARTIYKDIAVDEHSYHSAQWFEKQFHRYDRYLRNSAKVYMGEYSANGLMAGQKPTLETCNVWESALGEAVFMTGMERNGDVVEMSSYAPLLNLVDSRNWFSNLIDFNPSEVMPSANYFVQQLFATYYGPLGVDTEEDFPKKLYESVTEDSEYLYCKIVNTSDQALSLTIKGLPDGILEGEVLHSDDLKARNSLGFVGGPDMKIVPVAVNVETSDGTASVSIPGSSVMGLRICLNT